jgi:tRNA A37 methylthiotransferase MiaB
VPVPVRKERNRILRELAAEKNLAFRRRFAGRTLSVVTLEAGRALSSNYLQIELTQPGLAANRLMDVEVGGVTAAGLRQREAFPVLIS